MKPKPRSLGASMLALAASVLAGGPSSGGLDSPQTQALKLKRSYTPPLRYSYRNPYHNPNPLGQRPPYNQRKARRARHAHGDRKAFL